MKKIGIIKGDGFVETEDGKLFTLPFRGTDNFGFPEVLIDAILVGGKTEWQRQSIKDYVGMKVEFTTNNNISGYNFKIIKL
jgi:hypothetical protein